MTSLKNAPVKYKQVSDDKAKELQIAKNEQDAKLLNARQKFDDEVKSWGTRAQIKNGQIVFDGQKVEALDTKDAGQFGKDSFVYNMKDGQLTPERLALHAQIMNKYLGRIEAYGPNDKKVAMFTGGGGASGKGKYSKDIEGFYGVKNKTAVLDSDNIKRDLALADGHYTITKDGKLEGDLNPKLTGFYHEESSAIAKQLYTTALKNNQPVLFDGTAVGKSAFTKADQAHAAGYVTAICQVRADSATIRQNSITRAGKQTRLVPTAQLLSAHQKTFDSFDAQVKAGIYDQIKVYDNSGNKNKLIAEGSKSSLKILDKKAHNDFSKHKETFNWSADEIARYDAEAMAAINATLAERKK